MTAPICTISPRIGPCPAEDAATRRANDQRRDGLTFAGKYELIGNVSPGAGGRDQRHTDAFDAVAELNSKVWRLIEWPEVLSVRADDTPDRDRDQNREAD
jgi:hypothetical protein